MPVSITKSSFNIAALTPTDNAGNWVLSAAWEFCYQECSAAVDPVQTAMLTSAQKKDHDHLEGDFEIGFKR